MKLLRLTTRQGVLERSYEDYNQTISDADDAVSKAKDNMSEAWNAYNDYKKNNNNNTDDTDTTVSDSLQKTVEEKQEAYKRAVDELHGVEKETEEDDQGKIEEAQHKVDKAKDALSEAENALSAYNEQQNNNSSASYDEQLKCIIR